MYLYSVYDELVSAATAHPIPDRVSFAGVRTELHIVACFDVRCWLFPTHHVGAPGRIVVRGLTTVANDREHALLTAPTLVVPQKRDSHKSEIDRVVPAKFGIDDTWGAIPIGGELRARQTRAILVAAALYDTRRRQLLAALHGTAAEPAAKRQRTEETL